MNTQEVHKENRHETLYFHKNGGLDMFQWQIKSGNGLRMTQKKIPILFYFGTQFQDNLFLHFPVEVNQHIPAKYHIKDKGCGIIFVNQVQTRKDNFFPEFGNNPYFFILPVLASQKIPCLYFQRVCYLSCPLCISPDWPFSTYGLIYRYRIQGSPSADF